jgi:hypothetical protein
VSPVTNYTPCDCANATYALSYAER